MMHLTGRCVVNPNKLERHSSRNDRLRPGEVGRAVVLRRKGVEVQGTGVL
jgi:hypothetical protein